MEGLSHQGALGMGKETFDVWNAFPFSCGFILLNPRGGSSCLRFVIWRGVVVSWLEGDEEVLDNY